MATRFFVVDSGGTSRLIKRWGVVDSGGTTRMLKRAFVVDSGGTSRLIFASSVSYTLTSATGTDGFAYNFSGYDRASGTGSLSPGGTSNLLGNTFENLLDFRDITFNLYHHSWFQVSGFGADPGQNGFFTSVVCNGITRCHAWLISKCNGTL
jgi:hypothetical protein